MKKVIAISFVFLALQSHQYTKPEHVGYQYYLMKVIDYIFSKHDIKYWLDGGALIGAYRHNSFIPWDFDWDIEYRINDREKIKELETEFHKYGVHLVVPTVEKGILFLYLYFNDRTGVGKRADAELYATYDNMEGKICLEHSKITGCFKNFFWYSYQLESLVRKNIGPISVLTSGHYLEYINRCYGAKAMTEVGFSRSSMAEFYSSLDPPMTPDPYAPAEYIWPSKSEIKKNSFKPSYYFTEKDRDPCLIEDKNSFE